MSLKQWKYTNGYEPYETLPSVSSEDNGKVLGVSEGQYALVSGGGGGSNEPLIVNCDINTGGIDASYNQILSAILSGKNVFLLYEAENQTQYDTLQYIDCQGTAFAVNFYNRSFIASDPDENMYSAD